MHALPFLLLHPFNQYFCFSVFGAFYYFAHAQVIVTCFLDACWAVRPVPITSVLGQGQISPKRVVVSDHSFPFDGLVPRGGFDGFFFRLRCYSTVHHPLFIHVQSNTVTVEAEMGYGVRPLCSHTPPNLFRSCRTSLYTSIELIGMAACWAVRPVPITSVLGQGKMSPKRVVVSDHPIPLMD